MKKAASEKKGVDLKISKTRVEKTAQSCGSIFSELLRLERPLIELGAKALASAGLSFGEKKNTQESRRQWLWDKRNKVLKTCSGNNSRTEKGG